MATRKTPKECKEEEQSFKKELQELLVKHNVYLYAEDCYGAELTDIMAFKRGTFDSHVQSDETMEFLSD